MNIEVATIRAKRLLVAKGEQLSEVMKTRRGGREKCARAWSGVRRTEIDEETSRPPEPGEAEENGAGAEAKVSEPRCR
jgi:hypothetical protein